MIEEILLKRKMLLEELSNKKREELLDAPRGTVRIDTSKKHTQFYFREKCATNAGTYIPQKDFALVKALAQKEYDQKVLRSIEQEVRAIERYLSGLPKRKAEEVYEALHIERQKLIKPISETDEQFIQRWEQTVFQGKEIEDSVPLLYTEKGERVRSKSEVIIADILHREGIPYRYECPLQLKGFGKVHPDFTTLNRRKRKEIYWEHFGRMDDPVYAEGAIKKIKGYEKNGIVPGDNLIITWETKNIPINQAEIRREIERYLK